MTADANPTIRRRRLGAALREAREKARMTREQLAEELELSMSGVGRRESGRGGIRVRELRIHMDVIGITDPTVRAELEQLAREGRQRGWWTRYAGSLRPSFSTLLGLESAAVHIMAFDTVIVPGLLQTEDYARAVMQAAVPSLDNETITRRVAIRMERQQALPETIHCDYVLDEAVLYRQVGGPDVQRDQLAHLLHLAEQRRITVQVLPLSGGAHASVLGSFMVVEFAEERPVGFVELKAGDVFAEGDDADSYIAMFNNLRAVAIPPRLSLQLISDILAGKEIDRGTQRSLAQEHA